MLKKVLNIIVLSLFVISTSGFYISRHYCHGELVSVSVNAEAESCCSSDKCGCCHDEIQFYQLDNDFNATQNLALNPQLANIEIIVFNYSIIESVKEINKEIDQYDHGPPFIDRQFLFYTHQLKLAPPVC